MKAFLNDKEVKKMYINRVKAHQKSDEIVKGKYWEGGKGCAVGCTIHSSNHNAYETELGIPTWLAYVEDSLFEGMTVEKSKSWPFEFLNAIKVGVDLERVKAPFQIMVLTHVLKTLDELNFTDKKYPYVIECIAESKNVVKEVLELWKKYPEGPASVASAAMAARAAMAASVASADSAASAASVASADSAAWAASAARAARAASAASAASVASADSAAWAASAARAASVASAAMAASVASADSAASAARAATFDYFADELLKIISDLKDS